MSFSAKGNTGEFVGDTLGLNPGDSYIISTSSQKSLSQFKLFKLSAYNANQSKGKGSVVCDCVKNGFRPTKAFLLCYLIPDANVFRSCCQL